MPVKRRRFKYKPREQAVVTKAVKYAVDPRLKKYMPRHRMKVFADQYWEPKCGYEVMTYSDLDTRYKVEELGPKLKGYWIGSGCMMNSKNKNPCDTQFASKKGKGFTPDQALKFIKGIQKAGKMKIEVGRAFCVKGKK